MSSTHKWQCIIFVYFRQQFLAPDPFTKAVGVASFHLLLCILPGIYKFVYTNIILERVVLKLPHVFALSEISHFL